VWIEQNYPTAKAVASEVADGYAKLAELEVDHAFCLSILNRFLSTPDRSGRILGVRAPGEIGIASDLKRRRQERLDPLITTTTPHLYKARMTALALERNWSREAQDDAQ
jgi:hypothetical protein